jgi:hypothetical protein
MTAQSLDEVQGWFTILRSYTEQRDKAQEFIDLARSKIEEALGENETGLLAGVPVVKWTHVTTNRFDQKKAKAFLTDEQAAQCINTVESRRFVLLDATEVE